MENNRDDDDYFLYLLSEMYYKKQCVKLGYEEDDIFPFGWYGIRNYRRKTFILMEAIDDNKLIIETEMLYKMDMDPVSVMAADLVKEYESGKWDAIYLGKNGLTGHRGDNSIAIDPFCCLRINPPDSPEEMILLATSIADKTNEEGHLSFSVKPSTNEDGDTEYCFEKE